MPRPPKKRRICFQPEFKVFKPAGRPMRKSETIGLSLDEFEALRLVDMEGLYHEAAATQMGTSRATLGRILEIGREKVARALVHGLPLKISGGNVDICVEPRDECDACGTEITTENGRTEDTTCPDCGESVHPQVRLLCENRRYSCLRAPNHHAVANAD